MCLGGVEDEEHISQCEVLQPCREAREETGVDCRRSQDSDHGLLHSEDRDAVQRAWQGLFEPETGRQDCEGAYQAVKRPWLRGGDKEGCLIIDKTRATNGLQNGGRYLLVVATPEMKLTRPGLRTKECCHEHADEIFTIYPASC